MPIHRLHLVAMVAICTLILGLTGEAARHRSAPTGALDIHGQAREGSLIDLVWQAQNEPLYVGQVLELALIASPDSAESQLIAAMDLAIQWDAEYLLLIGVDNNGPYSWLSSGFPDDSGLDGLNTTFLDGDAFYQAWAAFGGPANATSAGLVVTTFQFEALQETDMASVAIVQQLGQFTVSRVFGGDFLGQDVTGQLGSASVRICAGDPGDDDDDGVENCDDLCPQTPLGESVNADGCGCSQFDCDDGQFCNGTEGCADGVCREGTAPECDDDNACTVDYCDPAAGEGSGACVSEPEPEGTACGDPVSTECDRPDSCDGSGLCQENPEPSTTECRPATGECDVAEFCDGVGSCPVDSFKPAHTPCGDSTAAKCDKPDTCDGNGICEANFEPSTTVCRTSVGECDRAELCDGNGQCPSNEFEPIGAPCGDPADTICDRPDACDGNGLCLDNFEPASKECRPDAGECDVPEFCDGTGGCPEDLTEPVGTACGNPNDTDCDNPDSCDGRGACRTNLELQGTACGDEIFCNGEETCDGNGLCMADTEACTDPWRPICDESSDECIDCLRPGDSDDDNDVDLQDLANLSQDEGCATPPTIGPAVDPPLYDPECRCLDIDGDGDIDLVDFAFFQGEFTST